MDVHLRIFRLVKICFTSGRACIIRSPLRGHRKTGQRWSLQNRPTESGLGLGCFTPTPPEEAVCFRAPTPWTTFKYVAVMKEAIEHGSDGGTIADKLTPVVHGTIRGEQSAGALIAPHYDFQQVLGGGHG